MEYEFDANPWSSISKGAKDLAQKILKYDINE